MKWSKICSFVGFTVGAIAASTSAPEIEIVGNHFYYSNNGSEFFVKGVAYQSDLTNATAGQTFVDPLADPTSCTRDVQYLKMLDTNVIRVYAINTSLDHTECIQTFADNGIYIISDLSNPGMSISRDDPQWNVELYQQYTSVVDSLQNYTNVLGFFAGNEVSNLANNTAASAFVKAAVRDMKSYIKAKNYRSLPIGYAAADVSDIRIPMTEYFVCGDSSETIDFYGLNIYEWCGSNTFQGSGYEATTQAYSIFNIPLIFSEYGCNTVQPRTFEETPPLYSSNMTGVWSGGVLYEYFEDVNNYGLVSIENGQVSTLSDFNAFSSQIVSVSPSIGNTNSVTAATTTMTCPASGSTWSANTNLPPTPNSAVCDCVSNAANCVVASSVSSADYGTLFGYLCSMMDCTGISGNGTSGVYGAYSFCDPTAQLNFLLNAYYESQGKSAAACSFSGSASINSAPSTAATCSSVLQQAGTAGTGSVTASITGVASGSQQASGSAAAASTSSKKSGAASVSKQLPVIGVILTTLALAMVLVM
jgi:1,3-beta-glucanosyltransferase GAS1